MHDTGWLGLVHWDDPEGWNGEGGRRRVQDGDAPGVDLMAPLTAVQLFTLTSDATRGAIRVNFWNASQAKLLGETFVTLSACARP